MFQNAFGKCQIDKNEIGNYTYEKSQMKWETGRKSKDRIQDVLLLGVVRKALQKVQDQRWEKEVLDIVGLLKRRFQAFVNIH